MRLGLLIHATTESPTHLAWQTQLSTRTSQDGKQATGQAGGVANWQRRVRFQLWSQTALLIRIQQQRGTPSSIELEQLHSYGQELCSCQDAVPWATSRWTASFLDCSQAAFQNAIATLSPA